MAVSGSQYGLDARIVSLMVKMPPRSCDAGRVQKIRKTKLMR